MKKLKILFGFLFILLTITQGFSQEKESEQEETDLIEDSGVKISLTRAFLNNIFLGEMEVTGVEGEPNFSPGAAVLIGGLSSGEITLSNGTAEDVKTFFSYFDEKNPNPVTLTNR
jgi:hypothetical protein